MRSAAGRIGLYYGCQRSNANPSQFQDNRLRIRLRLRAGSSVARVGSTYTNPKPQTILTDESEDHVPAQHQAAARFGTEEADVR